MLDKSVASNHHIDIDDHDWNQNAVADGWSGKYWNPYLTIVDGMRGK